MKEQVVNNVMSVDECTDKAMSILMGFDLEEKKRNKGVAPKAIASIAAMAIATTIPMSVSVSAVEPEKDDIVEPTTSVKKVFTTSTSASTVTQVSNTVYTTDYLRARLAPSLDGEIVRVYEPNTAVTMEVYDPEWSLVSIGNNHYYMATEYLSETKVDYNGVVDTSSDSDNDDEMAPDYLDDGVDFEDDAETDGYTSWDSYTNDTSYENDEEETVYVDSTDAFVSPSELRNMGIVSYGDYRYTWYSELALPGEGLDIPGRHVDENGYVCDENGYICLASDSLDKGTVIYTPLGKDGKVYDCGPGSDDILDVYVSW